MKLLPACLILGAFSAVAALAADTNKVASKPISVVLPALPGNAGTNDVQTPVVPGDHYTNSIGMELVKVGSFWAGKFEVTQKEFQQVTGSNPSAFGGENRPVENVSWNDAMNFCAKLTARELKAKDLPDGYFYTLPTESEWENLMAGASLADAVTSQNGPRGGTARVGSLGPNQLGLYDTRGNVMEFCLGDTGKPYRVLRGGSWQDRIEVNLRPEFRFYCKPDDRQNTFGFRCLLKANQGSTQSGS
jgi:formylglycine-generating enzyme required for sulfatase activity